jgi:hypothetical protein
MATLLKPSYGASASLTFTSAATLANGAAAGCLAVDNSSVLADDLLITLLATLATGTPVSDLAMNVYFGGSEDGTNYTDNYLGTDAAVTLRTPTNLRGPYVHGVNTAGALQWKMVIPSFLRFWGGLFLPRKCGIVLENKTGLALTALAATYTPMQWTNI